MLLTNLGFLIYINIIYIYNEFGIFNIYIKLIYEQIFDNFIIIKIEKNLDSFNFILIKLIKKIKKRNCGKLKYQQFAVINFNNQMIKQKINLVHNNYIICVILIIFSINFQNDVKFLLFSPNSPSNNKFSMIVYVKFGKHQI